jgi:hypothetical protein
VSLVFVCVPVQSCVRLCVFWHRVVWGVTGTVGGDWNCVLHPVDVIGGEQRSRMHGATKLHHFQLLANLYDVWRDVHGGDKLATHTTHHAHGSSGDRLDRWPSTLSHWVHQAGHVSHLFGTTLPSASLYPTTRLPCVARAFGVCQHTCWQATGTKPLQGLPAGVQTY